MIDICIRDFTAAKRKHQLQSVVLYCFVLLNAKLY